MNRRGFFNTMLGTAPTVAATLAMTPSSPASNAAVEFLNPMCPECCRVFSVIDLIPLGTHESFGERARRGCSPVPVTCSCGWQGQLTFYRRQSTQG